MGTRTKPDFCPSCGGPSIKPIVYGYPSSEMFDDPRIALGGCVIFEDSLAFVCDTCEHAWGERA